MKDNRVEVFLSEMYEPLYKYISMFAHKNDIEDIIQKSMLTFLTKYEFDKVQNPQALIIKISRNYVKLNYRKRNFEEMALSKFDSINYYDAQIYTVEQDIIDKLASGEVLEIIKKLPCDLSNILVEIYFNNKNIQEIAEEYGESKNTLYARRNRAIKALRRSVLSLGNIY